MSLNSMELEEIEERGYNRGVCEVTDELVDKLNELIEFYKELITREEISKSSFLLLCIIIRDLQSLYP